MGRPHLLLKFLRRGHGELLEDVRGLRRRSRWLVLRWRLVGRFLPKQPFIEECGIPAVGVLDEKGPEGTQGVIAVASPMVRLREVV